MSEKTQPYHKIRVGNVTATIWKNEDKEKREYFSITLEKHYKEGENWKSSNSYMTNDLFKVKLAIDQALTKIYEKKEDNV